MIPEESFQTQTCTACHAILPVSAFYRRNDVSLYARCKKCQKVAAKRWQAEHPTRALEHRKAYEQHQRQLRGPALIRGVISFAEIARRLGCSTMTALNIYRSGMSKLRAAATVEQRSLYAESVKLRDEGRRGAT